MLCEFGLANLRKLDSAPDMRVSPGFNITTQARASQSKPSKTNKPGMFNKPRAKQAEQAELAKQAMQAKQAEQARRHKRARQARQASQETGKLTNTKCFSTIGFECPRAQGGFSRSIKKQTPGMKMVEHTSKQKTRVFHLVFNNICAQTLPQYKK